MRVPTTQMASEKVAVMVATFLGAVHMVDTFLKHDISQPVSIKKYRVIFVISDGYPDGIKYHLPSFYNSNYLDFKIRLD